MSVFQTALDRLKSTRAYGAWTRYGEANGDLLAAGVGYFAFFSIFPALALAFAIFGFVLRGRPDLVETIAESLNATLPGMVKTAGHPEGIISVQAPAGLTLTITGIVSFVTLLLSGLGWVGALRTGIRGVFGLGASTDNIVRTKARDLFVLVTLGLAIAVSAILTSAVGGLAERVAGWIGLAGNGFLVGLLGLLAGVVFDTLILVVLLRMLSGASLPMHDVRQGALLGAVILTVLKLFGGFLVSHATANPLLGAVAVAVGLLFWLNLMSKVILLSAAWTANEAGLGSADADTVRYAVEPGPTDTSAPAGTTVHAVPAASAVSTDTGLETSRTTDRASLAAGAVLGAFAVSAVHGVRRVRRH